MVTFILSLLLFAIGIWRYVKHRALFQQLTRREWLYYIGGALLAWVVACTIIIGSSFFVRQLDSEWLKNGLMLVVIVSGLIVMRGILAKYVPEKIRAFHS